jgi:hypothetical protein
MTPPAAPSPAFSARRAGLRGRPSAEMLRRIGAAVRPRRRVRPSAWAREHVRLTENQSARPGPFNTDWKPWTADIHDVMFDNPGKLGFIFVKPGQIGASRAFINRLAGEVVTDPGPTLVVTTDDVQSKAFADEEFKPMLGSVRELGRLVAEASEDRRRLMFSFPFPGGRLTFVGAGSESKLVGQKFRRVILDEFDVVVKEFPGDPWVAAQVRTGTYRGVSEVSALSHPKRMGEGIEKLYAEQSDQRPWVFDCPHGCGFTIEPRWRACVRFGGALDDGSPDPATAGFFCPGCGAEISDAQRARAVWPARLGKGGTGRFESRLTPDEAARRRYAGIRVHRLCDPDITLRELAEGFCACTSEEALVEYFGKVLGEGYETQREGLTIDTVRAAMARMPRVVVPGGRRGVHFVCAGVDVQAPRDNPTLYVAVVAFAASGMEFVTHLRLVSGFAALAEFLRLAEVPVDDGVGGGKVERTLGVSCCGIDDRYEGGQVKDFCRLEDVYASATSGRVELVPMGFIASSTLNKDNPIVLRAERRRTHPTRPDLPAIPMYDLHRHSWVDRGIRAVAQERLKVLCEAPPDLEAHLTAQVLAPKQLQHRTNWTEPEMEWDLAKGRRDDWARAIDYARIAAAARMGLDRIHEMAADGPRGDGPRIIAPSW